MRQFLEAAVLRYECAKPGSRGSRLQLLGISHRHGVLFQNKLFCFLQGSAFAFRPLGRRGWLQGLWRWTCGLALWSLKFLLPFPTGAVLDFVLDFCLSFMDGSQA